LRCSPFSHPAALRENPGPPTREEGATLHPGRVADRFKAAVTAAEQKQILGITIDPLGAETGMMTLTLS
jgi:hypothetical protein